MENNSKTAPSKGLDEGPRVKGLSLQDFARFKLVHTVFTSTVPAGRPASAGSWAGSTALRNSQNLQGFELSRTGSVTILRGPGRKSAIAPQPEDFASVLAELTSHLTAQPQAFHVHPLAIHMVLVMVLQHR